MDNNSYSHNDGKFCFLWDRLKTQCRCKKYSPLLDELDEHYDIYHVLFTLPNVTGENLAKTLEKMQKGFSRLIEYFSGERRIEGLNFERYGYVGAMRFLEVKIIKGREGDKTFFQPRFHCAFVLKKSLNFLKTIENSHSYTKRINGQFMRVGFSVFETLLQKIWCLLMLDIPVTEENFWNIGPLTSGRYKDGFLVRVNKTNGKYHEIFKETITRSWNDPFTYDDFCCLSFALENIPVYEFYGCFSGFGLFEGD